ncbi:hypothetical protein Tco_0187328, partial [Tanacetum coccineum]
STAEGFNTGSILVTTASATLEVSIDVEKLVYISRSAEKRKDKGKTIMKEDESINEEEIQRIAKDAEIAKQLQEEFDRARQEQEVGGYKQSHFKGMSYEDIRPIFERSIKKNDKVKASGFVQKQPAQEEKEKKIDDSQQQAGSSKKRSREDSDEDNVKK